MDSSADGTHMIVLPGGGYADHAPPEAEPVASWLGEIGMQASVFRYSQAVEIVSRATVPRWRSSICLRTLSNVPGLGTLIVR